ncbi:MAG: fibronectin type III domain-containing protein [Nitrospirota bacterium]|nr:fibronectin type III domain-containing protein [Nitrospirota bacterium]
MIRLYYFILPLVFAFTLLSGANAIEDKPESSCLKCHEDIYVKAVTSPYQHSVIKGSCVLCHVMDDSANNRKVVLWSSTLQTEGTVFLGSLPDDRKYQAAVEVIDSNGKKSPTKFINIKPDETWKLSPGASTLKSISEVKLEQVRKAMYAEATISWTTDVPATSEVEYRPGAGEYKKMSASKNLFTKQHTADLSGLKHNTNYTYRVISRDISGNVLRSAEYSFDTSKKYISVTIQKDLTALTPLVTNLRAIRTENGNDYYLNVSANKSSQFVVWLQEIRETEGRPCKDFRQTRYSTIDVCITCHQQDSSHPVGVRSSNPRIVISDQLPTIEDGLITCVTCHFSHGGKKPYFLRIEFTKEICVKCHQSYYN